MTRLRGVISEIVRRRDEWSGDDGSHWIGFYSPDEPYLDCCGLENALEDAISTWSRDLPLEL